MSKTPRIQIVGSGLAGSEAAYYLASQDIPVTLHEMRPKKMTEAHQTGGAAELVCSNSLKSKAEHSAPGMLKKEMASIGSLILEAAGVAEVPSGQALGVDRDAFSKYVTEKLEAHPLIERKIGSEILEPFPSEVGPTLFATGPLTSEGLSKWIIKSTSESDLYFYDAIAPILEASSIDMNEAFLANRYDKGDEAAYLNCPMTKEQYDDFIAGLNQAEKVPTKGFEKERFFNGCQPIEAIAARGSESLRFGPMKPVGLTDPRTGERPYAVVQLRPENISKTAYNIVGFQTRLKWGEQKRVFAKIPALKNAEYLRLGSIHRNTYVCGPKVLRADLSLKGHPHVYLAGQITGVEGYLESAACGLMAGMFIAQRIKKLPHRAPPINTALGSMLRYITNGEPKSYQPTNIHFGLFEPSWFDGVIGLKKDLARETISKQAIQNFNHWHHPPEA